MPGTGYNKSNIEVVWLCSKPSKWIHRGRVEACEKICRDAAHLNGWSVVGIRTPDHNTTRTYNNGHSGLIKTDPCITVYVGYRQPIQDHYVGAGHFYLKYDKNGLPDELAAANDLVLSLNKKNPEIWDKRKRLIIDAFPISISSTASGKMMTAFLARSDPPGYGRARMKQTKPPSCKFSCTHCKATFKRAAHLRRHDKTHQNDKPYRCEVCPVSSTRKDVILRHTRNFHPELTSTNKDNSEPMGDSEDGEDHTHASPTSSVSPGSPSVNPTPWAPSFPNDPHQSPDNSGTTTSQTLLARGANLPEEGLLGSEVRQSETEFYSNEDPTVSDINVPDHEMLDFLAASDLAITSAWDIAADGGTPALNLTDFLSSWETNLPAAAVVDFQPALSPVPYSNEPTVGGRFGLTDDEYRKILANLADSNLGGILLYFQFPSKHAVVRFVMAFFKHMAPQFPVVHFPTFDIPSTPLPLLVVVLACGAMYSRESRTAGRLHKVALQLSSEHWKKGSKTQLWLLQCNLLMAFFEIYNADWKVPQRAITLLSETAKLAHEAYSMTKDLCRSNYKDWVLLESSIRCMAGMIIIGATTNSTLKEEYLKVPGMDFNFTLPTTESAWTKSEKDWEQPAEIPNVSDTIKVIHAGNSPDKKLSELGLLTIVSIFLGHVCSFELLTSSRHPHLWAVFVTEMSGPIRVLDDMCKRPHFGTGDDGNTFSPLLRTSRALLDSIYYHLYGSSQLLIMKELLSSPEALVDSENFSQLLQETSATPTSDKAIARAAKIFLEEARRGLFYQANLEASCFGPVATTAAFERDALISSGIAEVESQQDSNQNYSMPVVPLRASSIILQDTSVWKWPPVVSSKLETLIEKLNFLS
ncbi:Transcriptional regulator ADR1 [Paramyrothecium foliicola]|nr:Transcriptional regulator ADR1 [Paramyrothecium foliicola]